jgi:hypothetical protein
MPSRLLTATLAIALVGASLAPLDRASASPIPFVQNPDTPAAPVGRLVLEPVWRHGGLDDEEAFFGVIGGVSVDRDGTVLLADVQLVTVHRIAPDGELLPPVGRQGEGPGEVTRLGGVLPLADGTIGMVQLMPGQVMKVTPDDQPAGNLVVRWPEAGGRLMLQDLQQGGDALIAAGRRMTRGDSGPEIDQWIASLGPDGELAQMYYRDRTSRDFASGTVRESDFDWPGAGRWTATPDGLVILAPARNEYRLQVCGADGVVREFGRRFESRPRTGEEIAKVRSRFERRGPGRGGGRPVDLAIEVLPLAADIVGLHARPDGELWVQTSRSHLDQPAGVMLTYDVFDAAGNFTRQIAVECEGVAPRDALYPLAGDSFVLVKGHADAMAAMRGSETPDLSAEDVALEIVGLRPVTEP